MKHIFIILFLTLLEFGSFAQMQRTDSRMGGQSTVIRIDNSSTGNFYKQNDDAPSNSNQQTTVNENVSYFSSADGIVITINNGVNKIKLFALTGQVLFNGSLSQGRFLIQTRKGIYLLKINNNSYKVTCK